VFGMGTGVPSRYDHRKLETRERIPELIPSKGSASATTEVGWHYKFDSWSNSTVQKRRN